MTNEITPTQIAAEAIHWLRRSGPKLSVAQINNTMGGEGVGRGIIQIGDTERAMHIALTSQVDHLDKHIVTPGNPYYKAWRDAVIAAYIDILTERFPEAADLAVRINEG